ncbi:uro-adherence factor A-like isoform X2 [Centruroides vittatus]|uniref:uro-adherence factor A-like isoform X2 n=1 Tax=Centruroides vittatus TaxID=120091 RepID=UPI00350F4C7E
MAACSEQEVDGKASESTLDRASLLNSKIDDTRGRDTDGNSRVLRVDDNEVEKLNKSQDLKNLSDVEFLNLLEEASTFNKPSNEASDLLQQLRNEIAEKDSCENVEKTESSHDGNCASLIYGQNRNLKHAFTKGRDSCGMDILLPNTLNNEKDINCIIQRSLDSTGRNQSVFINKNKDNSIIKGINHSDRLGKTVIQSQSLQDLANNKSDSVETIRNAGISRGMPNLQKSQRASSFTSDVSEHAALLQVSVLESVRTSLKDAKTSFGKFQQTSLSAGSASLDKDGSHVNILKRNITSHALVNCATLNVCEVLNSSPERTCNSQKVFSTSNESSCDSSYNKFKAVSSNTNTDLHNLREFNEQSETVSPLELELKEIKVRNKSENDHVSEKMIENMYHQRRSDNKTYKDNTEVDVSVGFPLTYGHIRSQCNIMQSSIEAVCVDQDLSSITKGVHSEVKNTPEEKMQKKKKKNVRQENSDGNTLQEILPSSSFVRSFDDTRQFCSMDINGNPKYHTGSKVPYGITAVLPGSTFDCYSSGGNFHSENHSSKSDLALRKGKRNRNNIDNQKFIMAENIAGHRGEEDIDSLLEFINSSDHKAKTTKTNGTTSNQVCSSGGKHFMTSEVEKKKEKLPVKDRMKHYQSCNKKKSNHINSEEEEYQDKNEIQDSESDDKYIPICSDRPIKENSSEISEWNHDSDNFLNAEEKSVEVSLPVETESNEHLIVSETSVSISNQTIESKSSKISAENCEISGHQKLEESEFRVVLKKHRKRYPLKKADSSRFYNGSSAANYNSGHQYFVTKQTSHKDDIMLLRGLPLSHHSQRSKQDCARRKSTSSVPPSEHSSADNSDLDSVHSLPVSGSVPPPTRPHPHTTPPSTSSTPQASYADIARMSIAPTSKVYCSNLYGATFSSCIDKNISPVNFLHETFDSTNFQEKDGNNNNQFSLPNCPNTNTSANCENIQFVNDSNGSHNNEESLELIVSSNSKSDLDDFCKLSKLDKLDNERECITSQKISDKLNSDLEITETDDCMQHNLHLFNSDIHNVKEIKLMNDATNYNKHYLSNEINQKKKFFQKETEAKQQSKKISLSEVCIESFSINMHQEIVPTNTEQCLNSVTKFDAALDNSKLKSNEKPASFSLAENEKLLSKSKLIDSENFNNPRSNERHTGNEQVCFGGRQNRPPVIIMDNYLPAENACGVSFGIDLEELLHLSNGSHTITHSNHFIKEKALNLSTSSKKSHENEGAKSLEYSCSSVTDTVEEIERDNQQPFDSSSSPSSIVFLSNDDSLIQGRNITSSPGSKLVLLKSGQPLHWKEVDTDKQSFNFYQIVGFLGNSGGDIGGNGTEIGFYSDQ